MGLGYQSLNLLFGLWSDGKLKGLKNVLEIGAQDIKAPEMEIDLALAALTGKGGVQTRDPKGSKSQYSPKKLYLALGFSDYQCIDADGTNDAHVLDLNQDLRKQGFDGQFDLVTNFGTTEHCFDQFQAFRNIHQSCAVGGVMIHDVPFQGYLNHGLFNYQPNLFLDLARANAYDILGIYLNIDADCGSLSPYSDALMKYISIPSASASTMSLMVALRKTAASEFRTPYDGKYIGASKFKVEYKFDALPKSYLPIDTKVLTDSIPAKTLARILAERIKRKIRNYF